MLKTIREQTFETNSSSTHTLTLKNNDDNDYVSTDDKLVVYFMDTDEECVLLSLHEKVSYLVSQIVNKRKWQHNNYQSLKESVENCWDFCRIKDYVKRHFNKDLELPKDYKVINEYADEEDALSEIVNINHQLYSESLDECLSSLVTDHDLLDDVLSPKTMIVFGRD